MIRSLSMRYRFASLIIGDGVLALAALFTALLLRFGYREACNHAVFTKYQVLIILVGTTIFTSYLTECYVVERNTKKRVLTINSLIAGAASFFVLSALY